MLAMVTSGVTQVITWVSTVVTALVGEGALADTLGPLFAIGISISVILLGIFFMPNLNPGKNLEGCNCYC